MQYIICAVRDSKSEAFGRPFFSVSEGTAIRGFDDEVNRQDPENPLNKHPEDFTLYKLGTFNDTIGTFETHIPKVLIMADQCKKYSLKSEDITHV